jgi:DNA-nicking Smr family endonuclease
MAVDRRLDLHGMTQDEAHGALLDAITDAAGAGERCLLVVTGRGQPGTSRGVLRRMVPLWLESRRDVVLEWAEAQPRHGGAGALYVLLRRRRGA